MWGKLELGRQLHHLEGGRWVLGGGDVRVKHDGSLDT